MKPYLMIQYVIFWIRIILSPLIDILSLFIKPLKERRLFETLNESNPHARSFLLDNKHASLCLEVSSEGEWEQVYPLVWASLKRGLLIELIYASSSLEAKLHKLADEFMGQFRVLRLPIFSPWLLDRWVSADLIAFCRYDFYPELLLLKLRPNARFILFSASLKNKGNKLNSFVGRRQLIGLYSLFDHIFTASQRDFILFQNMGINPETLMPFEFRHQRIIDRIQSAESSLKAQNFDRFFHFMNDLRPERKIILGSCWPNEMIALKDPDLVTKIKSGEWVMALAPHKLNKEYVEAIVSELRKFAPELKVQIVDSGTTEFERGVAYILLYRGILCEMYTHFDISYVGGGFGRSIHSVLEPFWAGCFTLIGPKTHRSTEYDYFIDYAREDIAIMSELTEFSAKVAAFPKVRSNRSNLMESQLRLSSFAIQKIELMLEGLC